VELRAVEPDDVDAVQELIESDPGYTERITGYPPGSSDAQSLLMMRPESIPEDAKLVLGAWENDELVAVVDLLRGYPNESTAFIGLLEVHGKHQRRGLGAAAYGLVEQYVAGTWPEVEKLRLAVVDTNADTAAKFWVAMGFRQTGEAKPYRYDKLESVARLYEKQLTWSHPDLEVRTSEIEGDGLFASRPIQAGTVVAVLGGHRVDTKELTRLLDESDKPVDTITIGADEHLVLPTDPRPTIAYGNHSCDPNLWWIDAITLEARRDIAQGEELTSDYGTSTGVPYELTCNCGSPLCRGIVTGEDWKIPELQQRYGDNWIPALRKRMN
jgi:ribosomal protein S18 acetylase RimI-like enzyme